MTPREMTPAAFKRSLAGDRPPANGVVAALWWIKKGDWERAHTIVMGLESAEAAWVHAHLHRIEGDDANARYWYREAGRPVCAQDLDAEWEAIVAAFLD
jgi:hypothetical protein